MKPLPDHEHASAGHRGRARAARTRAARPYVPRASSSSVRELDTLARGHALGEPARDDRRLRETRRTSTRAPSRHRSHSPHGRWWTSATRRPSTRATTSCPRTVPAARRAELLDVRAAEPAREHFDRGLGCREIRQTRLSERVENDRPHRRHRRSGTTIAVKLHRCGNEWVKVRGHPCWKVEKALRTGVEHEVVPGLWPGAQAPTAVIRATGRRLYPGDPARRRHVVPRAVADMEKTIPRAS